MHAIHIAPWVVGYTVAWLISVWSFFGLSTSSFYNRLQLPTFSAPRLIHALSTTIAMSLQAAACVLINTNLEEWNRCLTAQVVSLATFTVGNFIFFRMQMISSVVVILMAVASSFQVWSWLTSIYIGQDEASWLIFFPMLWLLYLSGLHFVVWVKNRRLSKSRDVETPQGNGHDDVDE